MIIQGFFKFHDFSMHGTVLVIFQVFHDFQRLWEPCIRETSQASCYLTDKICLSIFVEGHLVTISTKLFSILIIGCRDKDALNFVYRHIRESSHGL